MVAPVPGNPTSGQGMAVSVAGVQVAGSGNPDDQVAASVGVEDAASTAEAPPETAGVQVQGAGIAALTTTVAAALPATGQPVGLIGLGFVSLAGAGALLRRRRSR
jgi:LPXTG-motif cell wall-anchored protein